MFSVKTRRVRYFFPAALFFAALLFPHDCFSYVTDTIGWTLNRTVVMHLSLGGPVALQDGSASFNESAADALNSWNATLAHMKFGYVLASPLPPNDSDADNSAFFSDTAFGEAFGRDTIALTFTSYRGSVRLESDVVFNKQEIWNSYRGPLQHALDFHRVALHEFGHVVGLNHPDEEGQTVTAIMNSQVSDVDALQPDDIAGARHLYNAGPPYRSSLPAPNLVNLSTRAFVGAGDNVLIGGFIIQGSQPAAVILRAVGHSLAARSVSNPLDDPVLELHNASGGLVAENDDWITGDDAETIASYRLDPSNSLESALYRSLPAGSYTVVMHGYDNATGVGLVELYDLHATTGRAGNISSRGQILTGDNVMIAGYIVGGNESKEVVVRALGPSLAAAGVSHALADPTIELFDGAGNRLASNDNWQSDPNASRVRDAGLAPTEAVEAALYANLNPGAYTAIMRGGSGGTGVGLIEVYDLVPPPN